MVNRILCSERTYRLLKEQAPNIPIHKRGTIKIKGKGEMKTYWVGGKLEQTINGAARCAVAIEEDTPEKVTWSRGRESMESSRGRGTESLGRYFY